ncbi:MAG TPA: isoprenylcysteine carboxylmethyltransferase family protein [Xanthobacteraceae bacterium]|nr:isoprenylcysteine carboxylmethyltransferase family protein [Xanthobacteraceae bacterium]
MHVLPLVGLLLLIGVAFCWRLWWQRRRYGTWGLAVFRSADVGQTGRAALAALLFVVLLGQAIMAATSPEWLAARRVDGEAMPQAIPLLGATLMFGGVLLVIAAQLHLGRAWRIGIDHDARPGLVTNGLYRFCRNPIYLGLLIAVVGYTVLVPTPLSIALMVGAYIGVRLQIAAEERYLARAYGAEYLGYARRVGRLLPGIGKFR